MKSLTQSFRAILWYSEVLDKKKWLIFCWRGIDDAAIWNQINKNQFKDVGLYTHCWFIHSSHMRRDWPLREVLSSEIGDAVDRTSPYEHPVNTTSSFLRPLCFDPKLSLLSHFLSYKTSLIRPSRSYGNIFMAPRGGRIYGVPLQL